jgi:Recombinase zinc beta ribbon domain
MVCDSRNPVQPRPTRSRRLSPFTHFLTGLPSPYLLSGLGQCARCGGTFIAMTRNHGSKRANFYGCGYNYKRGTTVCSNSLLIRQDILDQAVLSAITELLLRSRPPE